MCGGLKAMKSLKGEIINQILKIILDYKGAEKIAIFGSRATQEQKMTSDIDIAIFGRDWTDRDINIVKHRLEEEVQTPLKFDVLNFYSLSKDKLKENVLKKGRTIYEHRKD